MIKIAVRTVKFGGLDFTPEPLPSKDLNDTFGFVNDNFSKTAVPAGVKDRDTNVAAPTTTSASFEDVGSIVTNLTTSGFPIFVIVTATGKNSDAAGEIHMRISEGAEGAETDTSVGVFATGTNEVGLSTMDLFQPAAATPTTFHVQFRTNGTGTGTLDQITFIVFELSGTTT